MRQEIKIPEISDCWCGAKAKLIDWNFCDMWRVMCDKGHVMTKDCITRNRAVHRWNNRVKAKVKNPELIK